MTTTSRWTIVHPTPFGPLTISATDTGITNVTFRSRLSASSPEDGARLQTARLLVKRAQVELDEYLAGTRTTFTLPVDLDRLDTEHRTVLDAVRAVEYGETTTYGDLAKLVGLTDDGPRRVGIAMARNPVLIIVPCHRVVGVNGKLTGYAGGLRTKQALLEMEAVGRRPVQLAMTV